MAGDDGVNGGDGGGPGSPVSGFFHGRTGEEAVFPFPGFSGEQRETATEMLGAVDRFAADALDSAAFDQAGRFPTEYLEGMRELGLYGLAAPEEHGGMGLDTAVCARISQQISGLDASTATFLAGHQSIGYKPLLLRGTEEQKARWLPDLTSGKRIAAFCLTEPSSGSDAHSIKTHAARNADGTWTITGQKLWITNGGVADFYSIFCKTDHEEGGGTVQKITCFVVEKDAPGSKGLSFGKREDKMGIRASETRAVFLDKVVVPDGNVVGEPGEGFKIAMRVLNGGRLSLGAGCVGAMKTILGLASRHARQRVQFGRPIADFGLIQQKIARMASLTYASESLLYCTTGLIERGMGEHRLECAVCKTFCSESLWTVVDSGLQIAAGNGYMRDYPYERIMRDSRINLIFEGSNEILRVFLALSGVKDRADSMRRLREALAWRRCLTSPAKALGLALGFAANRIRNATGGRRLSRHHQDLGREASAFSSLLGRFAVQVENTVIRHGKRIVEDEYPQGRLADMAIRLYVMLAMLSRTTAVLERDDAPNEKKAHAKLLFRQAFRPLSRGFAADLEGMGRNADAETRELSGMVCDEGGYSLDVIHH